MLYQVYSPAIFGFSSGYPGGMIQCGSYHVMKRDVVITTSLVIPADEIQWQFARSGGPGGQNVNKVNSKAILRWFLSQNQTIPIAAMDRLKIIAANRITTEGELVLSCDEFRDQPKNIARCESKLRTMILQALHTPRVRKATRPSNSSNRRRLDEKRRTSEKKAGRRIPND